MFSIKRIIQEIRGERQLNIVAFISIFICQSILVISQVKVNQPGMCIYDSYAMISHSLGVSIIPIAILFTMLYMRNDFSVERIVRMKSFKLLWREVVTKIVILSMMFSIVSLLVGGIIGKFIAFETYSWDKKESIYFFVTGKLLSNLPYIEFVATFLISIFTSVLLMNLIMILVYWIFQSFAVGCFVSVALTVILGINASWIYSEKGVHYSIWMNPYDIKMQVIYPILICLPLIIVGFFIKRKDISLINKEGM